MPKVESNAALEALEKKKMNAAHWCVASLAIGLVGGMAPVFLMPWATRCQRLHWESL